jgi:hypothetical protein
VAWLAELFPNPEQREKALGYTQAFSSFGGLLVGSVFLLCVKMAPSLPAITMPNFLVATMGTITGTHASWRYTLMSGLIPAIPLIFIRPFLPESPVWQKKKMAGTLKRPSFGELFSPALCQTTIVTTIMVACSYGIAFGAIQQLPQIAPGLPEVKAQVAKAKEAAKAELDSLKGKDRAAAEKKLVRGIVDPTAGQLSLSQEVGGLFGRFLLALLVVPIVSRRLLIRLFMVPGLVLLPFVFGFLALQNQVLFHAGTWNVTSLHIGIFFAGLVTVAQFSFWGNYLPVVYPVHLRGTGESMAANVGGRMIGTSFAAVTSLLSGYVPGADDPTRVAYTAAGVAAFVCVVGVIASFFLPEPKEGAQE